MKRKYAGAAPDLKLHDLHQHTDDSENIVPTTLGRKIYVPRLCSFNATDMGIRQSIWAVRRNMNARLDIL
ncbi:hypothetical protein ACSLVK_18615 [Photorhabdus tasmaniensis]|uniref:hypothetical protein n=1 Tax=Photorhabdus tasmaniensis TaxID=1004159 RepID=UPI004041AC47